jgi:hypothetical protein
LLIAAITDSSSRKRVEAAEPPAPNHFIDIREFLMTDRGFASA